MIRSLVCGARKLVPGQRRTQVAACAAALAVLAPLPASAGAIAGSVSFEGKPPPRKPLAMATDPVCARTDQRSEAVVVHGGKLRDVHVRLRAGSVPGEHEPPDEPVTIDQSGCMYRPRVVGVIEGQQIAIKNGDMTMHNVHAYVDGDTAFNLGQPPRGPAIERGAKGAGDVMVLKCDVHPWMRAYAVITGHPFFDVTGKDGRFSIKNVPPGSYTLEAWHPELGLETAKVKVGGGVAETSFSFSK